MGPPPAAHAARGLRASGYLNCIAAHWETVGTYVPTNEHFLPLVHVLALQDPEEPVGFFAERVTLGSISMRSLRIG